MNMITATEARTAGPYLYRARDSAGKRVSGRLDARDRNDAALQLKQKGLFPISIETATAEARPASTPTLSRRKASDPKRPLTRAAAARFMARLAKLTEQQISVDRALGIIAEGDGKDGIAAKASVMRRAVREGTPLSAAVAETPGLADPAIAALLQGAEVSGDMAKALKTASGILETRLAAIRSVTTSLLYPAILFGIAIISVGIIMIAIIPQFRPLIEDRMDLVPFLGRTIFALSAFISALWPIIAAATLLAAGALWYLIRRGGLAPIWERAQRLPGLRKVVQRNQVTMVLHILGELLTREITLSHALQVVRRSASPGPIQDALQAASEAVSSGDSLSTALSQNGLVAADVLEMIRIGEEAGNLPEMVSRAAQEQREMATRSLERILLLFQPALIVGVGLMIGVSLYALFSAIVSVNAISF
ncbi:MAG: type II secretion system F family protein [Pseudomonadota bacterium]